MREKEQIKQVVFEVLESIGINVPIEMKFDISKYSEQEKIREFLRITKGDYRNAIYVRKLNIVNDKTICDMQYYDLLFCTNEKGEPICIPVPIARELFNLTRIDSIYCKGEISGPLYEYIFKHYYEDELPF